MKAWEKTLDAIRRGSIPVDIGSLTADVGVYELRELLQAVSDGYNKNLSRLNSLRNYINKELREKIS